MSEAAGGCCGDAGVAEEGCQVQLTQVPFPPAAVVHGRPGGKAGELVVTGAHGGAGTSTLVAWLRPAWDMGVLCRPGRDCPKVRTGGRPLVLVTRNTAAGSAQGTAAVNALAAQGVRVAVLAVVSDGLPDPAHAAYRFRLLGPRVGAVVRVPFVPLLRAVDDPAQLDMPRGARRAVAEIRAEACRVAGWAFPRTA